MTMPQVVAAINLAALSSMMLSMGLQVEMCDVARSLRRVGPVLAGVVVNFLLVPAVTLGLLQLYHSEPLVAAGFMILAVCPGAPVSPPMVKLARGDLPLAIGLMVLLGGLSAVLTPVLLSVILSRSGPPGEFRVDYSAVARTLFLAQLLPLACGLILRNRRPALTAKIAGPVARLAGVLMLALVAIILVGQYPTLADIRLRGWIGMTLLLVASLVLGWLAGGRDAGTRNALAVTSGPRNAAVGLAIATGSFAGTSAVTAVVAYGIMSALGTLAATALLRRLAPPAQST
ncbi:MAG: bile acid:sodium symporter [Gemmataceae bacterium]|nr:bile acid:sodium symporter [Gemmataceae bacterium]